MQRSVVVTVSDRCAAGVRSDTSGPVIADALLTAGYEVTSRLVPDGEDSVAGVLREVIADGARLIVTTGGTGVGPRDRTPEGTLQVLDRELPGVAELIRAGGVGKSRHAALTRGVAGVVDAGERGQGAFVVNLPGNPSAAAEGVEIVLGLAAHVLDQLAGGDH